MTTFPSEKKSGDPTRTVVKVWGSRKTPSWSVTVVEGTSDEELGRIVRQAIETWRAVGEELTGEPATPSDLTSLPRNEVREATPTASLEDDDIPF